MSNSVRFHVSKTQKPGDGNEGFSLANDNEMTGLAGVPSYGSLPASSLDGIHPSIAVVDADGSTRGGVYMQNYSYLCQ